MVYRQGSQFSLFGKRLQRFARLLSLCLVLELALGSSQLSAEPVKNILFFGDSLTAAYGLDPSVAYPAIIQKKIQAAGLSAKVTVGAVSGDTSAGGLRRIDWMLRQPVDIFVLALGGNDGLRGFEPTTTEANLKAILERVAKTYPEAQLVVAGMRIPPSLGADYSEQFATIYPSLAESTGAVLIPFLLEDVGGVIDLNLPDRIHPNAAGHKIVAENVWTILKPLLDEKINE